MSNTRHIKEPPVLGLNCKGFAYWKKCMTNYLKILELWDIVSNGFAVTRDANDKIDVASLQKIKQNDQAVNAILASVSETIAPTLGEATNAHDMWTALVRKYEGNDMLKKSKEERLQSMFESFRIEDHESIEDMYTRFTLLINEFIDVGDPLPPNKIVTKLIRIMMVRPSWRGYVGALQAVQGAREQFTPEEMYSHLKCYEETLRQAEGINPSTKTMAFAAQNSKPYNSSNSQNQFSSNIFNPSSSQSKPANEPYFQNFGSDQSKEIPILTKLLQAMFSFERRINSKREEEGKRVVCLNCEKEGHTIHTCYKLFPQMKNQDGNDKQDQKGNVKRDGYKGKKNPKAMQATTWDDDEEESVEEESNQGNEETSPFCFVAQLDQEGINKEDKYDFDHIIAVNNITDPIIIEYLRKVHIGKKKKEESIPVQNQEESIKETPIEEKGSSSRSVEDEVIACPSSPIKEAKVCLNSSLSKDGSSDILFCASVSDSDDDDEDYIEDTSNLTNEKMLELELARANKLLNETTQALLRSEDAIKGLTIKVLELESKVNDFETKEIKFEKQISTLKIDKQLLDIENRALKSTSVSKSDTRLDLTNLFKGQKSNDKSGLGYKRISPSFNVSKNPKSPKEKGKQIKIDKGKHANSQRHRNAPNHAFRYRFSNGYQTKNKPTPKYYNPTWSNRIYHKEPTGWRYEEKCMHVALKGSQLNEKSKFVSQQINILNTHKSLKTKTQAQELKDDYHNRFVRVMTNPPTSAVCNYCCRHGHVSFECKIRKGSNVNNVAWVPKTKK